MFFFNFLTFVFLFFAAEYFLYLYTPPDNSFTIGMEGLYIPDENTSFEMRPNYSGVFKMGAQKILFKTNNDGFRGATIESVKGAENPVVFLGDSFAFGMPVAENDYFVSEFEYQYFSSRNKNVLNLGICHTGTLDHLLRFKKLMKHAGFKPSLVIMSFYPLNDYADYTPDIVEKIGVNKDGLLYIKKVNVTLFKSIVSMLWPRLSQFIYTRLVLFLNRHEYFRYHGNSFESGNLFQLKYYQKNEVLESHKAIIKLKSILDEDDIPLIVLFIPGEIQVNPDPKHLPYIKTQKIDLFLPNKVMADFCKIHNIGFVDPTFELVKLEKS